MQNLRRHFLRHKKNKSSGSWFVNELLTIGGLVHDGYNQFLIFFAAV